MSKYLDDLRAAAEAEFAASRATQQPEPVAEPEAPAPEPVEPEAEVAPVVEEPTPEPERPNRRTVYKKVVDLGDGSPPQVFKAATKDELIDKILAAQTNASKRIKQLKEENKKLQQIVQPDPAQPVREYKPHSMSAEEELELSNELQSNPAKAITKAVEATLGAPIDEIRKDLADARMLKQKEAIHEIGRQFMAAHPEYPVNKTNEQRMAEYLQKNKLGWTLKNLELAFADLSEVGLIVGLQQAPVDHEDVEIEDEPEQQAVTPPAPVQPTQAPAAPVAPVQPTPTLVEVPRRRKAVVGISSSQAVATVEPESPREASVEDLLKMSPSERRRIVQAQFSRQA